jgi:uncharacterized protein YbjT (DUF2867 family)
MKVLILGASGGCGKWVTQLAAERGHSVTAVIRTQTPFSLPGGAHEIRGDVLASGFLDNVLSAERYDAVVSCVGIRRKRPWSPWSRLISPPDLTKRLATLLIPAMQQHGPRKLIAISAAGVGDSASRMSKINAWLFANSKVGIAYRDLEEMEKRLAASELDWQAVRPATLTNGKLTNGAREIDFYGATTRISRADVGAWIVNQLDRPISNSTPMIAS